MAKAKDGHVTEMLCRTKHVPLGVAQISAPGLLFSACTTMTSSYLVEKIFAGKFGLLSIGKKHASIDPK